MIIGVPTEIKNFENRVAITPAGVTDFIRSGHQVIIQAGAGLGSGIVDEEYLKAGATLVPTPEEVYKPAELILKVKEPVDYELELLRPGQILFAYLHLAASEELTKALLEREVIGIAYETVQLADGTLPLLAPMSEVAGSMAPQIGAYYLARTQGGRGILMGGVAGVEPANVVVLGGGHVGTRAAMMAAGLGAQVTVLEIAPARVRYLFETMPKNVKVLQSNQYTIEKTVSRCDLLIGAVLIPGSKAPKLVTREMLSTMKERAVMVDVAVDQGGCFETTRPSTHEDPVYYVDGILHYAVSNMPGAYPRTSTFALTNATMPYALKIANKGLVALREDAALARGLNLYRGSVTHLGVAAAFDLPHQAVEKVLVS